MITNTRKDNSNTGLSKFSESQLPQKESMQKYQAVSIPSQKKGTLQSIKEIKQINSSKEQQKKEGLTDLKEKQGQQSQQLEEQYHIPIGRQHTFNERKRAFSSPHPFYHYMRDSIHVKDQLIATPTFGDDDWKSRQLQNTKEKRDGINGCQSSPSNYGKVEGYDIFTSKVISNNSSIINAVKDSNINIEVMNNDSIGLQLKLANHQTLPQNAERSKRNSEIDLESYQFVDANSSMVHQTPQLCPQQNNLNDISSQSASALDLFEAGINSSNALKHPKISKKSPLFEKFGQYPSRQRSPDSHYNVNNPNNSNLSAYNYPCISKQSSKYSNLYLGSNNSSSSLQNSQCGIAQQQIGISTEGDLSSDHTPLKKNPMSNLYNHQINTGRSNSDKKQFSHRSINPVSLITAFNLRNNSEASILQMNQQKDKNLKINLNNTSSFLPQIDQPQSSIHLSQQAQSSKHSNEVRMLDRGFLEEGSSILSSIQRSNNLNQIVKQPLKRISSIDDQSISTCFTSIKASSPIKKNRNDIFNDFTFAQNQKTQDSENQSSQQLINNTQQEDNSTLQLNLLQGDKLNFTNLQPISKRSLAPPNSNQDRNEENSSLKYKESIRKRSREQSIRQISPTNTLDLIKRKNQVQTPQTVSNTIGSLVQYATRDETIDDLLNLQLDKIEIKKQNSQKRSSPSLDYQRNHSSNPPSTDIPDDENGKFTIPPQQINSYRQRKPNSIHIATSEKQKRAESAKNKSKLNFFQNQIVKKDFYGKKVEPESAKFSHPGRKLSIKQNETSSALDGYKAKIINPQAIQQETYQIQTYNIQKEIENLYNPQQEAVKQTEKICNRISGIFHKQKEIYEQKIKRKMTANKDEIDLLKQLNTALDELKNVHTFSAQTSSIKNNNNQLKQNE